MNLETIDFGALKNSDAFESKPPLINRLINPFPLFVQTVLFAIYIVLLIGALFIAMPFLLCIIGMILFSVHVLAGVAYIVLIVFGLYKLAKRQARIDRGRRSAIKVFAAQNEWSYGPSGGIINDAQLESSPLVAIPPDVILYSIKGELTEYKFELLVGWKVAKNAPLEPLVPQLYARTDASLPQALLVSRKVIDGGAKWADRLFLDFKNAEPVSLEGDFDSDFQLYAPKGAQVDAMALVAPDFMQVAIRHVANFCIKLTSHTVVLTPSAATGIDDIAVRDMFVAMGEIVKEVR